MNTVNRTARMAGLFYLLYILTTIGAQVFGRSRLVVLGDAAATARNIMAAEWPFRLSLVVDLVSAVLFFLAAWGLYVLLKPVNPGVALSFVLLNAAGTAVYAINLLNYLAAALLLGGASYLQAFQPGQLQALAMFFLTLHYSGSWLAQIFFAAWLLPLGYLVYKSGLVPRVLGIVIMVHFAGWLATFFQFFLFPGFQGLTSVTYPLGLISELGLTLWLLIMGAKERAPEAVPASLGAAS